MMQVIFPMSHQKDAIILTIQKETSHHNLSKTTHLHLSDMRPIGPREGHHHATHWVIKLMIIMPHGAIFMIILMPQFRVAFFTILGKTPIFMNLIGKLEWRNTQFGLVPDIPLGPIMIWGILGLDHYFHGLGWFIIIFMTIFITSQKR